MKDVDNQGTPLLHTAIRHGPAEMVNLLLRHGADVERADSLHGDRALHCAAKKGDSALLKSILAQGAALEGGNILGEKALHVAAQFGQMDCLTTLLEAGSRVNTLDGLGGTALHSAAAAGQTAACEFLLARGAAMNAKDSAGQTPAFMAASRGKIDTALMLLKKGADKDLLAAILLDETSTIEEAIKKQPLLVGTTFADDSVDLVSFAAKQGKDSIARVLVAAGADPNRQLRGKAPLHLAAATGKGSTVATLISIGARIDIRNAQGETALHEAAAHGNVDAATTLLALGASANAPDTYDCTPLHRAVSSDCSPEMLNCLIKGGADVHLADRNGTTPIGLMRHSRFRAAYVDVLQRNGIKAGF